MILRVHMYVHAHSGPQPTAKSAGAAVLNSF